MHSSSNMLFKLKFRNSSINTVPKPTIFSQKFGSKQHHASLSLHHQGFKPAASEEPLENEESSISFENTEAQKTDRDDGFKPILMIESLLRKEKDSPERRKSIAHFPGAEELVTSQNQNLLTIENYLPVTNKSGTVSRQKTKRSKSILGQNSSLSPERFPGSMVSSRKSVFSERKPIMSKNSKSFTDFTMAAYFTFRKNNESIKKGNLNNGKKSPSKHGEKEKFQEVKKEELSIIYDEKNDKANFSNERPFHPENKENIDQSPCLKKTTKVPKLKLPQPKYYHQHITKVINSEASFKLDGLQAFSSRPNSQRKNYVKENLKVQSARKPISSGSKDKNSPKPMIFQIKPPTKISRSKPYKQDSRNFYIELMRKLELLRFTSNLIDLKEKKRDPSIDIETVKLDANINELEVFQVVSSKFGKEYFTMLNRIFMIYAIQKGKSMAINLRQFLMFLREFFSEIIPSVISTTQIEIMFKKTVKNQDWVDLKGFVELLYDFHKSISKLPVNNANSDIFGIRIARNASPTSLSKTDEKKNQQGHVSKDQAFKKFLDMKILPKYKTICNRTKEPGYEKIQIFFQNYDDKENPVVEILLEKEELLKHLFSVYETLDIGVAKTSFINLKDFLRFSADFNIIPGIANANQITRIFMTYKKYETESIDYARFVILICCIAHIGFCKVGRLGFYEKLKRLLNFIEKNNEKISEKIILGRLLK